MSEAPARRATSRSPSAPESTVVAEFIPDATEGDGVPVRGRARARVHQAPAESQAYEYLPITQRGRPDRQPPRAARGAERHRRSRDAEWERFFTEKIAGANEGIVEKTVAHPGGPRPAPQARRRHDQEHHADRQEEHPQQPAAGHQPVRGRPGRRRRQARQPLRRDRARQRPAAGARRAEAPRRRHPRGVQPDRPLPARQLLGGLGSVRVRPALRDQQRHADEVLLEHDPPPAPRRGSRRRSGRARRRNSFEFTSWWADATNKPIQDLTGFTQTFFAKHTLLNILTRYCVLDRRPDAAGDAAVPDRRRPSGSCSGSRSRPTTSSSARSRPAATSGTPPARARR